MKFMQRYYSPNAQPGEPGGQESPGGGEQDSPQTFDADYVAKLRAEAAKYRTEAKEAKATINQLQPLAQRAQELDEANKSEAEKLAQKMADMQTQLDAAQATAKQAEQTQKLTTLAVKAGVSADLLPYLDVSKFDLENEEATLATLSTMKTKSTPNGGPPSNPGRGSGNDGSESPADWYKRMTGSKPSIFGGN